MTAIRALTPPDAPAVLEVLQACEATERDWAGPQWRPDATPREQRLAGWAVQLAHPDCAAVGVDVDGEVVGFACATPASAADGDPTRAELTIVAVQPTAWGRGHGRALVQSVTTELAERGYDEVELWAQRDNARARRLYDRGGWRCTAEERVNPHSNIPLVRYEASLLEVLAAAWSGPASLPTGVAGRG